MQYCSSLVMGSLVWLALLLTYNCVTSQGSPVLAAAAGVSGHDKAGEAALEAYEDKDEPSGAIVKRAWDRLQGGWGKRGWQNLQSGWGKRDANDRYPLADKRGWQNLQSGWGKRASNDRQWETDSDLDELYSGAQQQTGDYYEPSLIRSGMAMADNDYIDEEKRTWRNLNSAWGKRDGAKWGKFRGSWGKREPAWNNLKGLWG